jgi:hypothetical protein
MTGGFASVWLADATRVATNTEETATNEVRAILDGTDLGSLESPSMSVVLSSGRASFPPDHWSVDVPV